MIAQPRDGVFNDGNSKVQIRWSPSFSKDKNEAFNKAQDFVDSEVIRLSDVPVRSHILEKSAPLSTAIGSGNVIWNTPYARRQYYEHKEKGKWFETMKSRYKAQILEGARKLV